MNYIWSSEAQPKEKEFRKLRNINQNNRSNYSNYLTNVKERGLTRSRELSGVALEALPYKMGALFRAIVCYRNCYPDVFDVFEISK